jgi:large subunit ribosomal protein L5
MGNYTIGIRENSIFPETAEEELKDVFGLSVTIVTNVRGAAVADEFLRTIGFPIKVSEGK